MKKNVFLLSLCLLWCGMVKVCADPPCTQEIVLTESMTVGPLDNVDKEDESGVPNPTCFRATISGHELFVLADANKMMRLIVENNHTGEIVEERAFVSAVLVTIPQKGDYTLYIISDNTIVVGEFTIEQ